MTRGPLMICVSARQGLAPRLNVYFKKKNLSGGADVVREISCGEILSVPTKLPSCPLEFSKMSRCAAVPFRSFP